MDNFKKIIITTDGKTTLARLFSGTRVIAHAKAVCSQEDEFSFIVGSNLAFSRLLDRMMFPHEFTFNGKTVFFKNGAWGFTYGEVYTFVNGFTKDDYGNTFPYSGLSIENNTRLREEGFIAFNTTKEERGGAVEQFDKQEGVSIVQIIEDMRLAHLKQMQKLLQNRPTGLSDYQEQVMKDMYASMQTEGNIEYSKVQNYLSRIQGLNISYYIEPILRSYDKISKRLYDEMEVAEGEDKIDAYMHLAGWLCDAIYRFKLRLSVLDIGILDL